MADSEVDTTQQVPSKTPATKQKNPKRVAAGKLIAEKTKQAREAQKKALAEARVIIANNQIKTGSPAGAPPESPAAAVADKAAPDPPADEPTKITTTQWLSVISIIVSLVGIYYKREEIKGLLTPKKPQVHTPPPSPVLPRAPRHRLFCNELPAIACFATSSPR